MYVCCVLCVRVCGCGCDKKVGHISRRGGIDNISNTNLSYCKLNRTHRNCYRVTLLQIFRCF